MTKKIIKIVIGMILVIIGITILVLSYYMIVDIETKAPKQVESTCKLDVKEYQGRKVFIVTPKEGTKNDTKILYFHGGSYVAEATSKHWDFIEKVVIQTGSMVILPDYPLTPKYNYKNVFEMVEPLYKEIVEKVGNENLIVLGDSAGGGLSLALVEKMSQEEIKIPKKTILISPWLDVRLENSKIDEVQKVDKQLNKETLKIAGIAYAGEDGISSYLVNPIEGDLSKLKNVTILTGTADILNPDVHVLEEKAKSQNVVIDIKEYENASHVWIIDDTNSSKELVEEGFKDLIEKLN